MRRGALLAKIPSTMDACYAVEKEVDRVLSKFQGIDDHTTRSLQDLIDTVEYLRKEWSTTPAEHEMTAIQKDVLKQTMTKIKDTVMHLATDHRDLHGTVSKVGKAIDRNFVPDFSSTTSKDDIFNTPDKVELVNKVIIQHLQRHGFYEVADILMGEANVALEHSDKECYLELNHILDALQQHKLDPALHWVEVHRDALAMNNSSLEFKLHRLKFIELIRQGPPAQNEAIGYARTHFKQFVNRHEKDIQSLMGLLLYVPNGIDNSPYSCLLDREEWVDVYEIFLKDACTLLGISVNSPLTTCVNAGCTAIPALLSIKQVMMQRQVSGIWNGKDELPIEIDLGNDSRYHSMFACPILRQQSTDINPPMRLVCGHVISRDALNKLCNGSKMKCPYCPMEQSPTDARLIIF